MRPLPIAMLCTLALFISGTLVINGQLWHSARTATLTAARESAVRIDAILDEARQATHTVMPLAQGNCTPDAQYTLSREAALQPHIRAVGLLKGSTLWCSSFTGNSPRMFHQNSFSTAALTLYPGDLIAPGVPLLVYLTPASGGYVAVSISDVHLRDALVPVQGGQPLALIVDNRLLTREGEVHSLTASSARRLQVGSSHYPFSIGYALPPYFSLVRLFRQGGMLLIMVAILSLTAGSLLRRYLAKYTTPAENLKKALERGEIMPYYQPVVSGATGEIDGVEVLARWQHPRAGFIPPDAFIPVAEKSGLIIPLTQYLMEQVCADLVSLKAQLPDNLHIGINISAAHCRSPQLTRDCHGFLAAFGDKPVSLVLEITEREPLELTEEIRHRLTDLQRQGVMLALDDFGTGYSGLSYLNEFLVDIIKIDKSFVSRITGAPGSTRLIDCVIDMARRMSVSIVAEGVETQQQVDYLRQQAIPLLQGYFFYRPVPFAELAGILAK
ncbi:EAL domain-containing protein [Citrobacter werkmanii]|uniref:EAL domain-containing protein n=1 Tax=Citrobacter werkmanii TaxID=67827 RepID=UPI0026520BAD|nr:EAL domain-containing protein [Citrobacter werkmanii]MDN8559088.1 EAL domain-containing protein [Citrobacter werkmanii]